MTRNQIEYMKAKEAERANREKENLSRLDITTRQSTALMQLGETSRHNLATEAQAIQELGEKKRAAMAVESLRGAELEESKRHSEAVEAETARSHRVAEGETKRHNLATEAEQIRSAMARETETHRSNVAGETIQYARLGEEERAHRAGEAIQLSILSETQRANKARESETARHNIVGEHAEATRVKSDVVKAGASEKQAQAALQRADTQQYQAEYQEGFGAVHAAAESVNAISNLGKLAVALMGQ